MSEKAVFLDKDGTLIPDIFYNSNVEKITLCDGVVEGLTQLANNGYDLFVISNQPGIAYGYFNEEALMHVREKINSLLKIFGISLSGFYYCPHHPLGRIEPFNRTCNCRKPSPGLIFQAAKENGIDLKKSWMVGDILHDVEAGNRSGCRTVLIDNGNETEWKPGIFRNPEFKAGNMKEAAEYILQKELQADKNQRFLL